MNLNTRPNGKQTHSMKMALIGASLLPQDRERALKMWIDFRWRVKVMVSCTRDLEALIDETIVKVEAEIQGEALRRQIVTKFEEMRKRAQEIAARPDEFLGPISFDENEGPSPQ